MRYAGLLAPRRSTDAWINSQTFLSTFCHTNVFIYEMYTNTLCLCMSMNLPLHFTPHCKKNEFFHVFFKLDASPCKYLVSLTSAIIYRQYIHTLQMEQWTKFSVETSIIFVTSTRAPQTIRGTFQFCSDITYASESSILLRLPCLHCTKEFCTSFDANYFTRFPLFLLYSNRANTCLLIVELLFNILEPWQIQQFSMHPNEWISYEFAHFFSIDETTKNQGLSEQVFKNLILRITSFSLFIKNSKSSHPSWFFTPLYEATELVLKNSHFRAMTWKKNK